MQADEAAKKALRDLRTSVAENVPLVNPDFAAAADYVRSGRPFEIYSDASDFGWSCVLAQRETVHGVPRPIAVAARSFMEVQQRWTPMEREAHGMYEGVMELERYCKGYKKFLFTDHRNNTFRAKLNPSRRIAKKLLRIAVELDELNIERIYLAGEWNVLGD